jgi:hypothetical protein
MPTVEEEPEPEPPAAIPAPASAPDEPDSAIDALFGDTQFKEYEGGIADVTARPFTARAAPPSGTEPSGASRTQKVLLGVVGGLVAVLALIALFFLGTRLPTLLGPAPAVAIRTPSATPSPSSSVKPVGPIAVGVHPWTALLGGECLDPYTGPWAETFTVVSCTAPHPAQMVYRGTFDTGTDPGYPGVEKLQAQMALLCAAPGVIDLAAAGAYSDAQVQGSYPVDEDEWAEGQHDYFCFVNRSSGQPLTASVAIPRAPATPAP